MAQVRTRKRIWPDTTGSYTLYGSTYIVGRVNGYEQMEDVAGSGIDNAMILTRLHKSGGTISGERFDQFFGVWSTWNKVPYEISINEPGLDHDGSEAAAAARAYAIANPARHDILLPAFFAELRDFPKMIRFAGRIQNAAQDIIPTFLKCLAIWRRDAGGTPFGRGLTPDQFRKLVQARLTPQQQGGLSVFQYLAAANLALQFGWAPMIRDLQKMLSFQDAVNNRRKEINRLYSGSGMKRRITIYDKSKAYVVKDHPISSVAGWMSVDVLVSCTTKRWVTLNMKPSSPSQLPPTDQQLRNQMLGLSVHGLAASAWEALPWSWLIDWFTNISDIINLSNNELGLIIRANTMSLKRVKMTCPGIMVSYAPNGYKASSDMSTLFEHKQRAPGLISPDLLNVKLPILGGNQLSILGSLALLRGR